MIDPSNADKIEIISFVSKAKTNADKLLLQKLHYKLFGAFFSACLLAADLISQKCITQD